MVIWHFIFSMYYSAAYQTWRRLNLLSIVTLWSYIIDMVASFLLLGSLLQGLHLGPCL